MYNKRKTQRKENNLSNDESLPDMDLFEKVDIKKRKDMHPASAEGPKWKLWL